MNILLPPEILSSQKLSFNEKLLLGLYHTHHKKLGFTAMTNKDIGELFSLHPNIIGYCRKSLLEQGYIAIEKRKVYITGKIVLDPIELIDSRAVLIPKQIYQTKIPTGAKLLWGEYNSFSKGEKPYFSTREYTANRLNASKESITQWTKILEDHHFLTQTYIIGYGKNERQITTCRFDIIDEV